jgi:hypothetical protein
MRANLQLISEKKTNKHIIFVDNKEQLNAF